MNGDRRAIASSGVTWAHVAQSRLLGRVGLACIGGFFVALYAGGGGGHHGHDDSGLAGALAGLLMLVALGSFISSLVAWFGRGRVPGTLQLDEQMVVVHRGTTSTNVPRARIRSACVVQRYSLGHFVPSVELELLNGDIVAFEVESDERACSVVHALGFGLEPGQRRVHLTLGSPGRRLLHFPLAIAAYYMGSVASTVAVLFADGVGPRPPYAGLVMGLAMVGAYLFLRSVVRAPELTIGDDGIAYRAGLRRRFVPRHAITAIEQSTVALPLVIHAGAHTLSIHAGALDLERRAAATRVARARFGAGGRGDLGAGGYARAGRTLAAWREHLAQRLGAGGYREASQLSPIDEAAAVLSSAAATAEQRAGAALALRIAGEPPPRIRIAAAAAAGDDLRLALETIAETDDDTRIDRALRKLR